MSKHEQDALEDPSSGPPRDSPRDPGRLRNVLVTHADEPLGRRLVKRLHHDEGVDRIVAVGSGPPPRAFDHLARAGGRLRYARVDLRRHRPVADFFHSLSARDEPVDTVVHLPHHASLEPDERPTLAGVAGRTAEARLVLQHCVEQEAIERVVAVGSAFVYRLEPGNANRCAESSDLDFDPEVAPEIRSWIDCDMIFHSEIHADALEVALLRLPTVVASGGYVYLNPSLAHPGFPRLRPMGFDPLCALVCDKDVVRALRLAIHSHASGIFNVSGHETVPLSMLLRWTGDAGLSLPGPLLSAGARVAQWFGGEALGQAIDGDHLRYGFTLDTERAERELGFRPAYRIGLERSGDGRLRVESAPL